MGENYSITLRTKSIPTHDSFYKSVKEAQIPVRITMYAKDIHQPTNERVIEKSCVNVGASLSTKLDQIKNFRPWRHTKKPPEKLVSDGEKRKKSWQMKCLNHSTSKFLRGLDNVSIHSITPTRTRWLHDCRWWISRQRLMQKKNETTTAFLSIALVIRNWILQLKVFPKAG